MPAKLTPLQNLKALFTSNQTLTAELAAAQALVTTRDTELVTTREQLAAITVERDAHAASLAVFEANAATFASEREQLATDRTEFDSMLTSQVSSGVAVTMEALGIPAAELPASTPEPAAETAPEIFAKWASLKGREKSAYYQKHEAILSKPQPPVEKN